jgi:uncharacterized protein (DUF302 family)
MSELKTGLCRIVMLAFGLVLAACATKEVASMDEAAREDGVVRVQSAYAMDETIARLKNDIAGKGITFFLEVDQSGLAAGTGIPLRPSVLLIFGNPGLGSHFMTSNPAAGLDWPVRLLVVQDEAGEVWALYTDFEYIRRRHRIEDRDAQFQMAAEVIASITSSVRAE